MQLHYIIFIVFMSLSYLTYSRKMNDNCYYSCMYDMDNKLKDMCIDECNNEYWENCGKLNMDRLNKICGSFDDLTKQRDCFKFNRAYFSQLIGECYNKSDRNQKCAEGSYRINSCSTNYFNTCKDACRKR